jgi:Fe-S cluster biogenesis protein NfuA
MTESLQKALEVVRVGLVREGGDIEVVAFEGGVLFVRLKGQ